MASLYRSTRPIIGSSLRLLASRRYVTVKTMKDIPGPVGLPIIGSALDYIRLKDQVHEMFFQRVKEYGNIYKEKAFAGLPTTVSICDPDDIQTVFNADGIFPDRPEIPLFYDIRDKLGIPYGLLLSENEEWYEQRKPLSQFMMVPRKVGDYHAGFNGVSQDLMAAIKAIRSEDAHVVSNLPSLLFKWSFESISFLTLGKRLGSLNIGNVPPRCQEMIDSTQLLFESFQKAVFGLPLYKIYPTKLWKSLLDSQDKVYKIAMSFIEERIDEIKATYDIANDELPENADFLTSMIFSGNLKTDQLTGNAVDFLFAGIDTTSYLLLWSLYNIATNPDIQVNLRKEINEVVGDSEVVTPEHINKLTLLRNCVKETLRLYPVVPLNIRKLQQDVVLSGYKVPAGVMVTMPMLVIGQMEQYFPNSPEKFIPDRWNREGEYPKNRFVFLPFGFGPRMCIGRRVAELEVHIAIAQIIKKFNIEYPDPTPIDYILKGVLVPRKQFNLIFKDI